VPRNAQSRTQSGGENEVRRGVMRRFGQIALTLVIMGLALFGPSGDLGWGMAWAYLGLFVAAVTANACLLLRRAPELIAERSRAGQGTKQWDRTLSLLMSLVGPLSVWVVAGLDRRFGWSPELSLWTQLVALAIVALGYAVWAWAMVCNRYFAGLVRIQADRGHTVAIGGPYRYVRHPGYAAFVVMYHATAISLGSLWALIPSTLTMLFTVARTVLEDRTLREELPGYAECAQQARYRLVPRMW